MTVANYYRRNLPLTHLRLDLNPPPRQNPPMATMALRSLLRALPAIALLTPLLAATTRPNVLFINIDDLRCDTGCYGHPLVKTPNMDKLAASGMIFDQAHVQATFCNPSRNSFLTGLRPDTTKVLDNATPVFETLPDVVTLPRLFRDNGYHTYRLGKIFHGTGKFDDPKAWNKVVYPKITATGRQGEGRNLTGGRVKWCQWKACEGTDEDQPDGLVAKGAVDFLRDKPQQPFFLAVGFHKPHDPFFAPKKYFDHYPMAKLEPLLHRDPEDMTPLSPNHIGGGWWNEFKKWSDKERLEFMRAYYACTTFMDAQLGKVLNALDEQGLRDNTMIIMASDHGYHLGERQWWNKSTLLEYSTRTPLIAWTPGMKAGGKRCSQIVEFVDIYPTLTELCGIEPPPGLHGRSFVPLLDKPNQPWKQAAFSQLRKGGADGRAVRTRDWRYIEWAQGKEGRELYDCTRDPGEFHNLADKPEHAAKLAELRKILRAGP